MGPIGGRPPGANRAVGRETREQPDHGRPGTRRARANTPGMYASTPPRSLRVLVADDDEDMRAFVVATLQADGCSTAEAHDGDELLKLLREALDQPDLRPDVIVSDVKMPGLSGFGVLAALQRVKSSLPVILITIMSEDSIHV